MISKTYYAQNYAGIIVLGLSINTLKKYMLGANVVIKNNKIIYVQTLA